jgi:hypothetical protein
MRSIKLACLFVALISATAWAKNPVPLVNQLVPPSAKPGSGGFTLVVIGSDFSHSSSVYWNGTSRVTEFVSRSRLNALINAADVAKAGTASVTVVNSGKRIPASNVVYFPVRGRSASVVLTADPQLTTQGALVVGDFNNDGKLDVAVAQQSGNSTGILNVFLGKGNGDFEVPVQINLDVWPERIVSGDFNGDGNLDLIVTGFDQQQGGDVGLVFLGKGNGRFVLQKEIGPAFAAAVADFDGDGNLDLIAYQYSTGESVVFFGNGDGTFTSGSSFDDGVAPAVGDFNGDGKLDLAFSNDGIKSYGLDVWLGNGDGTFVYSDTYVNNCGGGTAAAAAVDMNNDGILDVVSSSGCVWLGNGDGTFTPNGGFTVGGTVYYVTVGDFNGDGKLDIGTTDVYNFAVLLGNGDGTIQKAIEFPADGIQTIGMGDFNGDGRLDLIGDSSTQTYLLLQDSVLLTPRQLDFGQRKVGTASQPQTAALKNDDSSPLEIQNISITGSDPKDFLQTNDCPAKLAPGATCKIKVRFRPTTQ